MWIARRAAGWRRRRGGRLGRGVGSDPPAGVWRLSSLSRSLRCSPSRSQPPSCGCGGAAMRGRGRSGVRAGGVVGEGGVCFALFCRGTLYCRGTHGLSPFWAAWRRWRRRSSTCWRSGPLGFCSRYSSSGSVAATAVPPLWSLPHRAGAGALPCLDGRRAADNAPPGCASSAAPRGWSAGRRSAECLSSPSNRCSRSPAACRSAARAAG